MTYVLALPLALVLGLPLVYLARRFALAVGQVDRPDAVRKRHVGDVPLAGGIGAYATVLATLWLLGPGNAASPLEGAALVLGGVALVLGAVDDRRDLPARFRIVCQAGLALVLALALDVRVTELGDVLGTGPVTFGAVASTAFTVFCVVGALNATNMIDGIDGLLGSLVMMSFAALAALAWLAGAAPATLCLACIGALAAFLVFNLGVLGERRRVFLGDSGSTMLGMLMAVLLIGRSQGPDAVLEPVVAGWLLGLPLLDTTVVMVRRVLQRRSPFSAGRDHLHHVLQDRGLSPRRTLACMVALHAAMLGTGLVAQLSNLPAWVFLYGFVVLTLTYFVLTPPGRTGAPTPIAPDEAPPGTTRRIELGARPAAIDPAAPAHRDRRDGGRRDHRPRPQAEPVD